MPVQMQVLSLSLDCFWFLAYDSVPWPRIGRWGDVARHFRGANIRHANLKRFPRKVSASRDASPLRAKTRRTDCEPWKRGD
jgi:hypothetical protein